MRFRRSATMFRSPIQTRSKRTARSAIFSSVSTSGLQWRSAPLPTKFSRSSSASPCSVAVGFKHSVVNMYFIPLGIFLHADISIADVLRNLHPVTHGMVRNAEALGYFPEANEFQFAPNRYVCDAAMLRAAAPHYRALIEQRAAGRGTCALLPPRARGSRRRRGGGRW